MRSNARKINSRSPILYRVCAFSLSLSANDNIAIVEEENKHLYLYLYLNSPWPGLIKLFAARESLVSNFPAGEWKIANLFYSAYATKMSKIGTVVYLKDIDLTMLVTFGVILAKTGIVVTPFTQEQMSRTCVQY